jgi:four helix bundle protein
MEHFDFKNLLVWQKAMDFTEEVLDICETVKGHYKLINQLEGASASVPQNISEGKGRFSLKEMINFLYYSRGSLYETVTLLNILYRKKHISEAKLNQLESEALEIAKMLNSLITSKKKCL